MFFAFQSDGIEHFLRFDQIAAASISSVSGDGSQMVTFTLTSGKQLVDVQVSADKVKELLSRLQPKGGGFAISS
ncbi:hypothetical protein J8F10_14325 [Gemmata sp. G18]|uniref:Uncharacterized protein n=1 Tax=Gemmata palustris TaxID=2822762 RepID=A0ABS5BRY9_9BACT|nr:hypothetical protein [Gemmata palustris]MBP3956453.1 hypothetical protein [Gemmata palustris]